VNESRPPTAPRPVNMGLARALEHHTSQGVVAIGWGGIEGEELGRF